LIQDPHKDKAVAEEHMTLKPQAPEASSTRSSWHDIWPWDWCIDNTIYMMLYELNWIRIPLDLELTTLNLYCIRYAVKEI
jgi:hypothetical protein